MKRIFKLLSCLLVFVLTFTLVGCKDGSVDELYGIYGLSSLYYEDADDVRYNYADKFDYIIMVVNEGGTIDLYSRVEGSIEQNYHFTYTINYSEDEENKGKDIVSSITLNEFIMLANYKKPTTAAENGYSLTTKEEYTMTFGNLSNRLKYFSLGLDKNKEEKTKFTVYRNNYAKMYDKISDRNIERAKKKQIKDRDDRLNKVDEEE